MIVSAEEKSVVGARTQNLHETLRMFAPALERSSKLSMLSGHDPLVVRPLFVVEIECSDVETLAEVDGVANNQPACLVVSLHDYKTNGSS